MSDRSISLKQLNERIDALVHDYDLEHKRLVEENRSSEAERIAAKIEALNDLRIELNDPEATVDVTENVQQTLNVISAQKIIKDEL